jgi:predicted nucleic acid-binding protein
LRLVLDCSAVLPWVFGDEATAATDRLLGEMGAGAEAVVPGLWHLEVGNVLVGAMKRKRIDQAGVEAFVTLLQELEIAVDPETSVRAWGKTLDLAQQHRLSVYDAAYLELALRRGLPLATLDKALAGACRAAGVKPVLT